MERFEGTGIFWLPGGEEQIAGTLLLDQELGMQLDLIGAFTPLEGRQPGTVVHERILGHAGKKYVTLGDCLRINSTLEMPGIRRETYKPGFALLGASFEQDEPLVFGKVGVSLLHLDEWIGRTGFKLSITEEQNPPKRVTEIGVTFTPAVEQVQPLPDGELKLAFAWSLSGGLRKAAQITESPYLTVAWKMPAGLPDALGEAGALQDLVTLAVGAAATFQEVRLWRAEASVDDTPASLSSITYFGPSSRASGKAEVKPRQADDMLFLFEQIGGLAAVAQWRNLAKDIRPVLGPLFSARYESRMFIEHRYQSTVLAAETLHRARFPNEVVPQREFEDRRDRILALVHSDDREWLAKQLQYSNEPRLFKRLKTLALFVGAPFRDSLGGTSMDKWCVAATTLRNRMTHHEGGVTFDPRHFYCMSETAFLLVALALLRSSGVPSESLSSVPTNRRIRHMAESVPATVTEILERAKLA